MNRWSWLKSGIMLGMVFFVTVALVKPIGVSTQFVITDAMIWDKVDDSVITQSTTNKSGWESSNAYLNKSGGKYAKNAMDPANYSYIFVLSLMLGAFVSSRLKGGDKPTQAERDIPQVWRTRFGDCKATRYLAAFFAGFLVLYGARLAGGCTSGHMMSGMMQTSLSGYIFALGAFITGIPLAILMFKNGGKK